MGPRSFNRGNILFDMDNDYGNSASMGPRSFNRGNYAMVVRATTRPVCFNGAAVFQPRKSRRGRCTFPERRLLQWGRGLSTAEMHQAHGRLHRALGASMGPRSFN